MVVEESLEVEMSSKGKIVGLDDIGKKGSNLGYFAEKEVSRPRVVLTL